jgi:nucleoside-diphosphate-sugar epimerase
LAASPLWETLAGKTLLITGATGMLGAHLALAADSANRTGGYGIRLLLTGRNREKAAALFGGVECRFLFQDIREPLECDAPIHCMIHAAGPVGPAVFESSPDEVLSVNVEGTLSLLRYAVRNGCMGFVFASTHEVYGHAEGERTESSLPERIDPTEPRSCYILAKQAAENALACFHKKHGLRAMSARLSRLYGPLMNLAGGLFVCDFMNDAVNGNPVHVRGGLNLLRPLCHATDAAEAVLRILVLGEAGEAYNVQGDGLPRIGEIAEMIAAHKNLPVRADRPETKSLPPVGHWLNTDKLKGLGWEPRLAPADGLRRTLEYFDNAGELP